jgi:hypothetical protein
MRADRGAQTIAQRKAVNGVVGAWLVDAHQLQPASAGDFDAAMPSGLKWPI